MVKEVQISLATVYDKQLGRNELPNKSLNVESCSDSEKILVSIINFIKLPTLLSDESSELKFLILLLRTVQMFLT